MFASIGTDITALMALTNPGVEFAEKAKAQSMSDPRTTLGPRIVDSACHFDRDLGESATSSRIAAHQVQVCE